MVLNFANKIKGNKKGKSMKLAEIYEFLDRLSPFETQASWDNSGLLLGNFNDEIQKIYISLDCDENLVANADENALFITHHPLIFSPLRDLAGQNYPKSLIKTMIRKNQSLIALHTNYDLSHLNAYFAEQILGFKVASKDEFIIYADIDMNLSELVAYIKKKLGVKVLKTTFAGKERVKRLAICTGSGGDLIEKVLLNGSCGINSQQSKAVECFLSGDFKYHHALAALESGLSLIDIGHYESESCFAKSLSKHLQNLPIKAIICVSKNPFDYL